MTKPVSVYIGTAWQMVVMSILFITLFLNHSKALSVAHKGEFQDLDYQGCADKLDSRREPLSKSPDMDGCAHCQYIKSCAGQHSQG